MPQAFTISRLENGKLHDQILLIIKRGWAVWICVVSKKQEHATFSLCSDNEWPLWHVDPSWDKQMRKDEEADELMNNWMFACLDLWQCWLVKVHVKLIGDPIFPLDVAVCGLWTLQDVAFTLSSELHDPEPDKVIEKMDQIRG